MAPSGSDISVEQWETIARGLISSYKTTVGEVLTAQISSRRGESPEAGQLLGAYGVLSNYSQGQSARVLLLSDVENIKQSLLVFEATLGATDPKLASCQSALNDFSDLAKSIREDHRTDINTISNHTNKLNSFRNDHRSVMGSAKQHQVNSDFLKLKKGVEKTFKFLKAKHLQLMHRGEVSGPLKDGANGLLLLKTDMGNYDLSESQPGLNEVASMAERYANITDKLQQHLDEQPQESFLGKVGRELSDVVKSVFSGVTGAEVTLSRVGTLESAIEASKGALKSIEAISQDLDEPKVGGGGPGCP